MPELALGLPQEEQSRSWGKLAVILRMVKFSHTVFALPVALMSAFLASDGWPSMEKLLLIVLAMVGARNAAMAFNRLVDLEYDRANPRTRQRALPRGELSLRQVRLFIVACSALFIGAAYLLGRLAFILSPFTLLVLFFYSYTKRFTSCSHLFLGVALGLAPLGAWVGVRDSLSLIPLVLGLAVLFWVAGFDIIYACQDLDFDRRTGLHSIPRRFGLRGALWLSALFHLATAGLLLWVMFLARLGGYYFLGWLGVSVLLIYEHYLVSPADLSRLGKAFFLVNSLVSVVLCLGTLLDVLV